MELQAWVHHTDRPRLFHLEDGKRHGLARSSIYILSQRKCDDRNSSYRASKVGVSTKRLASKFGRTESFERVCLLKCKRVVWSSKSEHHLKEDAMVNLSRQRIKMFQRGDDVILPSQSFVGRVPSEVREGGSTLIEILTRLPMEFSQKSPAQ